MTDWSQSAFLQALGWATLNSFWQMALLWLVFAGSDSIFRLSPGKKYMAALVSLGIGFTWFICTFIFYFNQGTAGLLPLADHTMAPTSDTWQVILSSASVAYLLLLVFPAYRLFKNWQYIEYLKKYGLQKTALEYRLFVKKVAGRLGIKKPVHVYLSNLITSPVTIGYVKPIILLPVAALNSLSPQQVEAVLLHELSHIRRYDYLVNLIITLLHTLLYFNPFVKKLIAAIETEREKCCDELVIQFEYDSVSYASALLTLEKNASAAAHDVLALGVTGKKHLLRRIEKIVGQEKKQPFTFNQFAGFMASLLLVILINSLFFVSKNGEKARPMAYEGLDNPVYAFTNSNFRSSLPSGSLPLAGGEHATALAPVSVQKNRTGNSRPEILIEEIPQTEDFYPTDIVQVAFDPFEQQVSSEKKAQISSTLEATKKVLRTGQWQEVEKAIADGMTESEKEMAKKEYLQELDLVNWNNLEIKLKAEYDRMDWNRINQQLGQALVSIQLDSIQKNYSMVLSQLEKAEKAKNNPCTAVVPLPDASVKEVKAAKEQLRQRIDSIRIIRTKKVISL